MSHLTFGGLLRALYDKKWRDSGADTHHQSSPTTLHFSSLSSLTTDPNPPFLRISIRMFKKLPSHLSLLFRKTYWISKLHIPYFTTFVTSCAERSSLTWSNNKIIYHFRDTFIKKRKQQLALPSGLYVCMCLRICLEREKEKSEG